jgi:hypothetical protein
MTTIRAAAVVLAAALAGVGCGGDEDTASDFREGYNEAIERLNRVNSNIQESAVELAGSSGREIAREFEQIASNAARTRVDLADLEPPDDARDEFDELLAAIDRGVEDIRATAAAARRENQQRFLEAAQELSRSGEEITEAENALKRAVDG